MSFLKRLLLVLLILLLPAQLGFHFWPSWSLVSGIRIDYLSPTLYLTDVISLGLLLLFFNEVKGTIATSLQKHPKKMLLTALVISLNVYLSVIPLLSFYRWGRLLFSLLLARVLFRERKAVKALFLATIPFTLLWTSVLALFQIAQRGSLNGILYWLGERRFSVETPGIALSKLMPTVSLRPYATLPHPNVLAGVLLVLWLLWYKLEGKRTVRFWYVTSIVFIVFLLTESYSAWIALILCGILSVLWKAGFSMSSYLQKVLVLFFVFISLLSPILFSFASIDVGAFVGKNTKERIALSIEAGVVVTQYPLLGSGFGTFISQIPTAITNVPQTFITGVTSLLQPVHNVPLLLFSETGALGILFFLSVLLTTPITAPVVSILVISLFDHYWITLTQPILTLVFLFVLHPYLLNRKP